MVDARVERTGWRGMKQCSSSELRSWFMFLVPCTRWRIAGLMLFALAFASGQLIAAVQGDVPPAAAPSEQAATAATPRLEDIVFAAIHSDRIIEFYGEASAQMGVIGLVHRDGDRIALITLASQRKDAPWYAMQSCELSEDKGRVAEIVGSAAPRECESVCFASDAANFISNARDTPPQDGVKLADALMQARALRADCRRLVDLEDTDARAVLREQCAAQLKALPPTPRAQSIRTAAQWLVWMEVMDAQQCALRFLEGWRAADGAFHEIIHALQGIGARSLCNQAMQLYIPIDGACISLCDDACYSARAWEIVASFAARMAAMRAGMSMLEVELNFELETAINTCGIEATVAAALRSDLKAYVAEIAAAVPTTLQMTPRLAVECGRRVREELCRSIDPHPLDSPRITLEIRCRNDLLNEMLNVYGGLLHASDLLNDQERVTLAAQVQGIVAQGVSKIDQVMNAYRDYQAAQGTPVSRKYLVALEELLDANRQAIRAPFENQWVTWNVFPYSANAFAELTESLSSFDRDFERDQADELEFGGEYDLQESLQLSLLRSGSWGFDGLPTMAAYGAGNRVLGGLGQGANVRGISVQPLTSGGASLGYGTPAPWEPRMWFDRRAMDARLGDARPRNAPR